MQASGGGVHRGGWAERAGGHRWVRTVACGGLGRPGGRPPEPPGRGRPGGRPPGTTGRVSATGGQRDAGRIGGGHDRHPADQRSRRKDTDQVGDGTTRWGRRGTDRIDRDTGMGAGRARRSRARSARGRRGEATARDGDRGRRSADCDRRIRTIPRARGTRSHAPPEHHLSRRTRISSLVLPASVIAAEIRPARPPGPTGTNLVASKGNFPSENVIFPPGLSGFGSVFGGEVLCLPHA